MGTRSNIAMVNEDGSVTMVYCHFDGYPSNNGRILNEHYNDHEDLLSLLSNGDMSSLGKSVNSTTFYHRDRDEDWEHTQPKTYKDWDTFLANAGQAWEEYLYVFNNGKWQMLSYHDRENGFRDLEEVLSVERS